MTDITLGGNPVSTHGSLPEIGSKAPDFLLVGPGFESVRKSDFDGQRLVLNIFPSIGTGVCSMSVRKFNERAAGLENTTVICISRDLPFAHKAFCGAEGIEDVVMGSDFRSSFGEEYGVTMINGDWEGLLSRAVVVVGTDGRVVYTEQVPEIGQEPDYDAAIAALG